MYTLKEAAELCGVHVRTIRRYIASGKLQAEHAIGKRGQEWAVSWEALEEAGLRPMTTHDNGSIEAEVVNDSVHLNGDNDGDSVHHPDDSDDDNEADDAGNAQLMNIIVQQREQLSVYRTMVDNLHDMVDKVSSVQETLVQELKEAHERDVDRLLQERERLLAEINATRQEVAATRDEVRAWVDKTMEASKQRRGFRWPWQR